MGIATTPMEDLPALMRVEQAARYLQVSRSKAYALVAEGRLPVVRVGRSVRINREKLLAWLERNTAEVA
jgi:excisionase family DNA binding protein